VLVVPKIALVDSEGQRGVYQPSEDSKATFKAVKVGIEDSERAEILEGLSEGETIVSVGAGALRRNDQLLVAGQDGPSPGAGSPAGRGGRPGMGGRQRSGPQDGAGRQNQPSGQNPPAGRRPQSQRPLQQRPVA